MSNNAARWEWETWRDSPKRPHPHTVRDAYYAGWDRALRYAADVMLDPSRGLPFDDDGDRATVSSWVLEWADDTEQTSI